MIADHFDALFDADADPWRTRTRWYEARKRALTLAMLPAARFGRAFEPGCGAGELTLALAERCDALLATDASAQAARRARERVAGLAHVRVAQARLPRDWPAGSFDLVVVSELGYYLSTPDLHEFVAALQRSLTADGTVVACHWRHPADDLRQRAADVHGALTAGLGDAMAHYEDADLLLDLWCRDTRSVARREGLS